MHRRTIPIHTFIIPHVMANINFYDLYVSYKQNDNIILEKTLDGVIRDKCKIMGPLMQEEILLLTENIPTYAQIRLEDMYGCALTSQYAPIKIKLIIKDGEI